MNKIYLRDFINNINNDIDNSSLFVIFFGYHIKVGKNILFDIDEYNNIIYNLTKKKSIKIIENTKINDKINNHYYLICKKMKINKSFYENYNYLDILKKIVVEEDIYYEFLKVVEKLNNYKSANNIININLRNNFWFFFNYNI